MPRRGRTLLAVGRTSCLAVVSTLLFASLLVALLPTGMDELARDVEDDLGGGTARGYAAPTCLGAAVGKRKYRARLVKGTPQSSMYNCDRRTITLTNRWDHGSHSSFRAAVRGRKLRSNGHVGRNRCHHNDRALGPHSHMIRSVRPSYSTSKENLELRRLVPWITYI